MRDLLFKNLTSQEKHKRRLSMTETVNQNGILARTNRHAVYSLDEVASADQKIESPILNVIRFHDSKTKTDKIFCKMKGKIYAFFNEKVYLVSFVHTLRIELIDSKLDS